MLACMSLESWKQEFYPMKANQTSVDDALDHSIRKWEGLQPENLAKHGVHLWRQYSAGFYRVVEIGQEGHPEHDRVRIDASTCALCIHFDYDSGSLNGCGDCPLGQVRGVPCTERTEAEENRISPWGSFLQCGDPQPMLVQLRRAKDMVEQKEKS